jgi:hypothetical protein
MSWKKAEGRRSLIANRGVTLGKARVSKWT